MCANAAMPQTVVSDLNSLRVLAALATRIGVGRADIVVQSECRDRGAALMGIVNVTPDSFFDGGSLLDPGAARARIEQLIAEGASSVDIGGESSQPRASSVPADEQIRRIEPAVKYAVSLGRALVSVDTTSPVVARRMLELGADLINDVSCLADPELAGVVAGYDAVLLLMHARGPMSSMAGFSKYPESGYADVVAEVTTEWGRARDQAVARGVPTERVWFDPGIGFSKSARHSFEVIQRLREFTLLGVPVVVGPSRKSFINAADGANTGAPAPPSERLGGTIAACLAAVEGGATVLRVHDVAPVRQALAVARAISPSSSVKEEELRA
jgi:dihydropteroate synthase